MNDFFDNELKVGDGILVPGEDNLLFGLLIEKLGNDRSWLIGTWMVLFEGDKNCIREVYQNNKELVKVEDSQLGKERLKWIWKKRKKYKIEDK